MSKVSKSRDAHLTRSVAYRTVTGFCALLFFVVSFGWIRSYFVFEGASRQVRTVDFAEVRGSSCGVNSFNGRLLVYYGSARMNLAADEASQAFGPVWSYWKRPASIVRPEYEGFLWKLGFRYEGVSLMPGQVGRGFRLYFPYWLLVLLLAAIVVWSLLRVLRSRRRLLKNLCYRCGYDLRASKDRCPECGSPIPAPATPFVMTRQPRQS